MPKSPGAERILEARQRIITHTEVYNLSSDFTKVFFTEEEIKARVKQLAEEISAYYKKMAAGEVVAIGILRGSVIFMSDLIRKIDIPLMIDFMSIRSYGNSTTSSGSVEIIQDISLPLEGKHVLIVEDIVDSGLTLTSLKENLWAKGPKTLKVCSLLSKPSRRQVEVDIDFLGFEVPDEFLIGYGLDYANYYRELPFIAALNPRVYLEDTSK